MKKILLLLLFIPLGVGLYLIARPSLKVDVVPAFHAALVSTVYATGVVESKEQADLSSLVTARIVKFHVEEGDKVEKGTVLVEFDDQEARASVASLQAQLHFQEIELKRQTELALKKFGSEQAKDSAQSMVDRLKADLDAAQKRLSEHKIIAPQDGVILKKEGDIGEIVQPGKILISIGKPDNLHIEAEVDEEGMPGLKVGQNVLINADAFPDLVLEGKVSDITPLGDSVNKNYRIYIAFNHQTPLSISMTVDCNIITDQKEKALLVPATAIKDGQLWRVVGGELRLQRIKIGIRGDRFFEVLEGLDEGDEVVIKHKDEFQVGQKVRTSTTVMKIEKDDT